MESKFAWIKSTACLFTIFGMPLAAWADGMGKHEEKAPRADAKEATPSARCCPNIGHGPFITADFIYWQVNEDQIPYAIKRRVEPNSESQTIREINPGWHPGFKVGLGYNLPYHGWDLYLDFTWLQA